MGSQVTISQPRRNVQPPNISTTIQKIPGNRSFAVVVSKEPHPIELTIGGNLCFSLRGEAQNWQEVIEGGGFHPAIPAGHVQRYFMGSQETIFRKRLNKFELSEATKIFAVFPLLAG